MLCKVIVLLGILLLYYILRLHNSEEIETNTYFIRLCQDDRENFSWSNVNDTFMIDMKSSKNYLMNLSDPKIKYKPIYGRPYSVNRDSNMSFYAFYSDSDELIFEEDGRITRNNGSNIMEYFDNQISCIKYAEKNEILIELLVTDKSIERTDNLLSTVHQIGLSIALPCLIITILIYGFISELRTLHGKQMMCYSGGIFILNLFHLPYGTSNTLFGDLEHFYIKHAAPVTYFFYFYAYLWINIICIEMWDDLRIGVKCREKHVKKRFLMQCFYALSVPVAFFSLLLSKTGSDKLLVRFRHYSYINLNTNCSVTNNRMILLYYFYFPISVCLCISVAYFGLILFKICCIQTSLKHSIYIPEDIQVFKSTRSRTIRYLVIILMMTTVWILDIYIWIQRDDSCEPNYFFEVVSLIGDVFKFSQGILIFLMFVWRKKVKNAIWKRYTEIKNYLTTTEVVRREGITTVASTTKSKNSVAISTFTIVDLTKTLKRKNRSNPAK